MQSSDLSGPSPPYDGLKDRLPADDRDSTIKSIEELLSSGRSVGEILAAMGTPLAHSEQCEPEISPVQTPARSSTAMRQHGPKGPTLLSVTESDCSSTTGPRSPEPLVALPRRRRMAWPVAWVVFCGTALAGLALFVDHSMSAANIIAADTKIAERGTEATVVIAPDVEVQATVPNSPATTVSPPAAKKVLPLAAPKVPLVAASILPPPFGNTAPGPKAISNRAVKKSSQIEHAPVQATRRIRSVGPKKYVRDRPYYAPQRQQYVALRQVSLPDRGWGGGQYGPSPFSENGQ